MKYLLDSNCIIDYLSVRFEEQALKQVRAIIQDDFFISVITKIEVLGFIPNKTTLETATTVFMDIAKSFPLTDEIVSQTIEIRKHHKIKIPDAVIAATAMVHGMTLLSRNINDFKNIDGLTVIDPHTLN